MESIPKEVVIAALGGGVITLISNLLKGPLKRFNTQLVVIVVSIVAGLAYYGFQTYLPAGLQEQFLTFFWGSATAAVFIYEFIWKNLKKVPAALGLTDK